MEINGAKVRLLRENAGLTLTELARRARVSKAFLSQIETEQKNCSPPVAARLATVLDVAIVDLRYEA